MALWFSVLSAGTGWSQMIAFTGINTDSEAGGPYDHLAFVALGDISGSATIFFTDNELSTSGEGWDSNNESYWSWTAPGAGVDAGTIVQFSGFSNSSDLNTNLGTIDNLTPSADWGFSTSGETIFAYLGTSQAPTSFLAAISTSGGDDFANGFNSTGLVDGENAVRLTANIDIGAYNGTRSGLTSVASYAALIADASNWVEENGNGMQADDAMFPDVPFSTEAFTAEAVPEPSAFAVVLGVAALVGATSRRRPRMA